MRFAACEKVRTRHVITPAKNRKKKPAQNHVEQSRSRNEVLSLDEQLEQKRTLLHAFSRRRTKIQCKNSVDGDFNHGCICAPADNNTEHGACQRGCYEANFCIRKQTARHFRIKLNQKLRSRRRERQSQFPIKVWAAKATAQPPPCIWIATISKQSKRTNSLFPKLLLKQSDIQFFIHCRIGYVQLLVSFWRDGAFLNYTVQCSVKALLVESIYTDSESLFLVGRILQITL